MVTASGWFCQAGTSRTSSSVPLPDSPSGLFFPPGPAFSSTCAGFCVFPAAAVGCSGVSAPDYGADRRLLLARRGSWSDKGSKCCAARWSRRSCCRPHPSAALRLSDCHLSASFLVLSCSGWRAQKQLRGPVDHGGLSSPKRRSCSTPTYQVGGGPSSWGLPLAALSAPSLRPHTAPALNQPCEDIWLPRSSQR